MEYEVFPARTVSVIAGAVVAALGLDVRVEVKVQQGVYLRGNLQDDVSTVAAVSAVGAAEGDELFAVDGGAAVATVTGLQMQNDAINELWHSFPLLSFRPN